MEEAPKDAVVRAWTHLVRAQHLVLSSIEADLKKAGLPPLHWYDALLELERAGEAGIRPYELEQRMLLPQYGLSRLLDRMQKEGLVERRPCEDDRRGQLVAVTKEGRRIRYRMWPVYAGALNERIGLRLTERQAAQLQALLSRLLEGGDQPDPAVPNQENLE